MAFSLIRFPLPTHVVFRCSPSQLKATLLKRRDRLNKAPIHGFLFLPWQLECFFSNIGSRYGGHFGAFRSFVSSNSPRDAEALDASKKTQLGETRNTSFDHDALEQSLTDNKDEEHSRPRNIMRLFQIIRKESRTLVFALIALICSSSATLVFPVVMGKMIDFMIQPSSEINFNLIAAGLMAAFAVTSTATFARSLLLGIASQRITVKLRSDLFKSLISRDISFFDKKTTGELINRLSADTEVMSRALIENIARGLKRISAGIGGFAILLYLSPRLVLTMVIIAPPIFVGALYYGRMARNLATKVTDKFANATSFAEERLNSIRIVRLFNQTDQEAKVYSERLMEVFDVAKRAVLYHSGFVSMVIFGINTSMLLILYQGANIVAAGSMTTGELASFLMYSMYVGAACTSLGNLYSEFIRALGSSHRVFSLIDEAEREKAAARAPKIRSFNFVNEPSFQGKITFEDVSFSYPTRKHIPILKNLNLTINPGITTAVVGQSGCGKSTLALLCMRFYEPDKGKIYIDHTPIADIDPSILRQFIGMVYQDTTLFSGTIAQNIAYGRPNATQTEIEDVARKAYVHEFLHSGINYDTLIGPRGASLSGGQRQRIAIARALIRNPKILILDEATSFLDTENEYLVQTALKRLMAGRTVFCIAHRISVIKNAHQIVVLDGGRVAESGTYQELMSSNGQLKKILQNV